MNVQGWRLSKARRLKSGTAAPWETQKAPSFSEDFWWPLSPSPTSKSVFLYHNGPRERERCWFQEQVLFPSSVRESRGALPFLCIESYCFLGMEGLWSLLYYQRCLFSKAFKFLSCASHAAQGKHQIFALYSPPDCIYIVHLSELRYFKNLRFSTPLSVEIQMTTLQSDEKLGKTWKSLWLFPPN